MGVMLTVMCDHPSWTTNGTTRLRAFGSGEQVWAVAAGPDAWQLCGQVDIEPEVFRLERVPPLAPRTLGKRLIGLGPVVRWRNPDLWDAVATAIIRQVIRADQARQLYQRFCSAHGTPVDTSCGVTYAMPSAARVAELPVEEFKAVGLAFKSRPLRSAAAAYLEHGEKWRELPAARLVEELQTVPRIGPWTAGAAIADYCHDWALYPYGDIAVRKWAATAAPDIDWPGNEEAFAAQWREVTGGQLGMLTVLTLAWGGIHGVTP